MVIFPANLTYENFNFFRFKINVFRMSAQPVGKSDMQTLRDENEVLRSLLVKVSLFILNTLPKLL